MIRKKHSAIFYPYILALHHASIDKQLFFLIHDSLRVILTL